MLSKKRAANIIGEYSGIGVTDVDVWPDPKVNTCYAIRCTLSGVIVYYLLTHWDSSIPDASAAVSCLEEVELDSWPPESGEPQFFL